MTAHTCTHCQGGTWEILQGTGRGCHLEAAKQVAFFQDFAFSLVTLLVMLKDKIIYSQNCQSFDRSIPLTFKLHVHFKKTRPKNAQRKVH